MIVKVICCIIYHFNLAVRLPLRTSNGYNFFFVVTVYEDTTHFYHLNYPYISVISVGTFINDSQHQFDNFYTRYHRRARGCGL